MSMNYFFINLIYTSVNHLLSFYMLRFSLEAGAKV